MSAGDRLPWIVNISMLAGFCTVVLEFWCGITVSNINIGNISVQMLQQNEELLPKN